MRRFFKILLYALGALLAFLLLVAGLTQTQFFRDRLREAAVSALDSLLVADVQLGELRGNLVAGFSLGPIAISAHGDTLVAAERLELQYDIFQIPGKTVAVHSLVLVRPHVRLASDPGGVWNFQRMIRSGPADTAAGTPFDWSVILRSLELQDGSFTLTDSGALASPDHVPPRPDHVEYHRFVVSHINLKAALTLTGTARTLAIRSLSFVSDQAALNLDQLSGEIRMTPEGARVKGLELATQGSRLKLDADLQGVDVTAGIDLEALRDAPVRVRLQSAGLALRELGALLPAVDFLRGAVSMDLEARGTFGELNVERLNITVGGSQLTVSGDVLNLHRPQDLLLDVRLTGVAMSTGDARRLLPDMGIPDLPDLAPATITADFRGEPLDFRTRLSAETPGGGAEADVALTIGGEPGLRYTVQASVRGMNPALVFQEPRLAGSLNGTVAVAGSGVTLNDLAATFEATIDSSFLFEKPVLPSRLSLRADGGTVAGALDLRTGGARASFTATVTGLPGPGAAFEVDGEVVNLNLQDFLRERAFDSDLTMRVRARGAGIRADTVSGEALLEITDSRYGDYRIEGGSLRLLLDQHDPAERELSLESNIADFSLKGAFDLDYLVDLLSYEIRNIRLAVGEKFAAVNPRLATVIDRADLEQQGRRLQRAQTPLRASYLLRLKDLVPLSRVTGNRTFDGVGTLRGEILGGYDNLSLEGRMSMQEFFYGNADSGILLQDVDATLQMTDLRPTDPLRLLEVFIITDAGKMHINRTRFDSLQVTFRYSQEYSSYTARGVYDRALSARVNGIAEVDSGSVIFTLNGMRIGYRDFLWDADGGAVFSFGAQGAEVRDLVMRRDSQAVRLQGALGSGGTLSAELRAETLSLEGIRDLLAEADREGDAGSFAGAADLTLLAGGSLARPAFTASLLVNRFAFRNIPFGTIRGAFRYADGGLEADLSAQYRALTEAERPALTVRGVIPVALGAADSGAPPRALDLRIRSDGMHISILDPLLPTFNQLSGIVRCDVSMTGTLQDPEIVGDLGIDSCSFLFEPNRISYLFEGRFQPAGSRIRVLDAVVRNVAADRRLGRDGTLRISGDFALRELAPTDFDLTAVGSLLVVKETTRRSALSVYGDLFLETDARGLRFTGTAARSLLRGYVLIKNSSLVFPPTTASAREPERAVPVVLLDDTTRTAEPSAESAGAEYFGPAAESASLAAAPASASPSFLDGLRYDLEIESRGGNTEIRMVFNPATGEELVAFLDGKFAILEDGKQWIGSVSVQRATYNFTKRFEAEGTLRYSGDFLNPELDITARYSGTRSLSDSVAGTVRENVVVILRITGTRYEPRLEISMTIDGRDYQSYTGPKSADVGSDAIQFLITGNFPLTESQKNDIAADIRSTVGISLVTGATSLLSNTLSEFLRRETGFINSIEIGYGAEGGGGASADIRISGVVGDGLWRIGGRVLEDPFNNANFSLLYSLGDIFRRPSLRNFMFELERRVEMTTGQQLGRKETNSARLFYRISF